MPSELFGPITLISTLLQLLLLLHSHIGGDVLAEAKLVTKLISSSLGSTSSFDERDLPAFIRENFPDAKNNATVAAAIVSSLLKNVPASSRYACYRVEENSDSSGQKEKLIGIASFVSDIDETLPESVEPIEWASPRRLHSVSILHSASDEEQLGAMHGLIHEMKGDFGYRGLSVLVDEGKLKVILRLGFHLEEVQSLPQQLARKSSSTSAASSAAAVFKLKSSIKKEALAKGLVELHDRIPAQQGIQPTLGVPGWFIPPVAEGHSSVGDPFQQLSTAAWLFYHPALVELPLVSGTLTNKDGSAREKGSGLRHYYIRRLNLYKNKVDVKAGNTFFQKHVKGCQLIPEHAIENFEVHALYYQGAKEIVSAMGAIYVESVDKNSDKQSIEFKENPTKQGPEYEAKLRHFFEKLYLIFAFGTSKEEQGKGAGLTLASHFIPYLGSTSTPFHRDVIGTTFSVERDMVSVYKAYFRSGYRVFARTTPTGPRVWAVLNLLGVGHMMELEFPTEKECRQLEADMCVDAALSRKPPVLTSSYAVFMYRDKFTVPTTQEEDTCRLYTEEIAEALKEEEKKKSGKKEE